MMLAFTVKWAEGPAVWSPTACLDALSKSLLLSVHTQKHTPGEANKLIIRHQTSLWHVPNRLSALKGAVGRNLMSYSQKLIL